MAVGSLVLHGNRSFEVGRRSVAIAYGREQPISGRLTRNPYGHCAPVCYCSWLRPVRY